MHLKMRGFIGVMRKRMLVRIVSLVLALSLAGCSSKATNDDLPAETAGETQTEEFLNGAAEESVDVQPENTDTIEPDSSQEETEFTENMADESIDSAHEGTDVEDEVDNALVLEEEAVEDLIPDEQETSSVKDEPSDEESLEKEQLNSFSMMYYLAITAEEIRTSKNNRLILDDIYTSLLNDINPGSVDEITQDHLQNLRDIIKDYLNISVKRERLQYIYNTNKAAAIRSAIPNPLAILSMTHSLDWKKLAVVQTAV